MGVAVEGVATRIDGGVVRGTAASSEGGTSSVTVAIGVEASGPLEPGQKVEITNTKLAPCHRPHRKNTVTRLKYVRADPWRLPPIGM